jgi:primase-polymerase (primpol)-like protein
MNSNNALLPLPDDLTELDRWGLWRLETVGPRREAKVPYSISGKRASTVDPRAWGTFEDAAAAFVSSPKGKYSGLGFLFVEADGIAGIDLDDVLEESGELKEWGRGIVGRFADTYTEISPSGTGLKIWARGSLPANLPSVRVANGDGSIELYHAARYFTVTGRAFAGAPLQVEEHSADLLHMYEKLSAGARKVWPLQPLTGGRIPHGQQHSTLVSIAGTLRARRVCDDAILACLLAVNAYQCERPGPPEAISRIVRSTRSWGSR